MSLSYPAKRIMTLIGMDVLLVAELAYAFYRGFTTTADFSETFLTAYVPLFAPTVLVSFALLQWFKRREAAAQATSDPGAVAG